MKTKDFRTRSMDASAGVVGALGGCARVPALTAVVVNHESWGDVARLAGILGGSRAARSGDLEIVVVDNGSGARRGPPGDLGCELARAGVRLVDGGGNLGFAGGVNLGRRAARAPWLLVLNPDVTMSSETVDGLIAALGAGPRGFRGGRRPAIVGLGLENPGGGTQPSAGPFPSLGRVLRELPRPRASRKYYEAGRTVSGAVPWVTGACFLVETAFLDAAGGMDEEFFLYHEEVALCRTAWASGRRVEYAPEYRAVHHHPLQHRAVSPRMRVILRHSKLLYFRKHRPGWERAALAGLIGLESWARWVWAVWRGDAVNARASSATIRLAFRLGSGGGWYPRGARVLRLADWAATGRPRAFRGRSRRDGGRVGAPGPHLELNACSVSSSSSDSRVVETGIRGDSRGV